MKDKVLIQLMLIQGFSFCNIMIEEWGMTLLEQYWNTPYISDEIDWPMIDIEFAANISPFKAHNTDTYNEEMFIQATLQMTERFQSLFPEDTEVEIIFNIQLNEGYDSLNRVLQAMNVLGPAKHSVSYTERFADPVANQDMEAESKQFFFDSHVETILASDIFKAIANKDFPDRLPKLFSKEIGEDWQVYFVTTELIYFPYDDRGANVIFKSIEKRNQYIAENPGVFLV